MQARSMRSVPAEHLEDLAYLTAHLKADPLAKEIATDMEAESATLKAQIDDWSSKRHAVQETQTGLGNMTEALRNAARHAHDVILDDLRRNRRAPKFLTYFPRGLTAFGKATYLELVTDVRSLVQRCAQDPSARVQEQGTLLQAALDQMDAALDHRAQAQADEGAAYGQLQVQKNQSIEACRRAAFHLAVIYPNERDRVRSYFRKVTRRPRSTAPAEGEPASTTGTTLTGTTGTSTTGKVVTGSTTTGTSTTAPATATASEATPAAPVLSLTQAAAGS
jgi:hypothetical protein